MSAGVCGKRVGFEEIFGPSSPTSCSSAKRPRSSSFGSGSDDSVLVLLQMFPDLDPKVRFHDFSVIYYILCHFYSFNQIPR
jgi:hypothetical protein